MYSASDPTWRPSNHSFSISCVHWMDTTRTLLQASTHNNRWHLQSLGTVCSTIVQNKNCVVYFVRFWITFDLSCIFITFTSISITQGIWRSLRGCVTGWFLLRPRVIQTLLNAVAKKAVIWFFDIRISIANLVFFRLCFAFVDTIKVSAVL